MRRVFIGQSNKLSLLFLISIIVYSISSYYKVYSANDLFDSRELNREFTINLSKEFKEKAGIIISKNNFDPIMPNTLLRILLRTEENYISGYKYDGKKLILSAFKSANIIDIRDIVDYLVINKSNNDYILYLR